MTKTLLLTILTVLLTSTSPMIMRNNALMTKMVSQFQGKEQRRSPPEPFEDKEFKQKSSQNFDKFPISEESSDLKYPQENSDKINTAGNSKHVLALMQNVLCANFPMIPCSLITKDDTLKNLIEKSIQQLKYKKLAMIKTTTPGNYQLTLFPVVNSEELSRFLQVSNTGVFKAKRNKKKTHKNKGRKKHWLNEMKNKTQTAVIGGRKKIRKFYPHKIKYKDKSPTRDFPDSEEKFSMSVENLLDTHGDNIIKRKHFNYRNEPSDPPVWRIDYTKHGEPNINMFGQESDDLKGKVMKSVPNMVVDGNVVGQSVRRDVLHPDLYIKNNYAKITKPVKDFNSDNMD